MNRSASPEHAIHPLVAARWSPRSFSSKAVTVPELRALLEAARWAPSSRNEQPWRFIVARREDSAAFEAALGCLNEGNRRWAATAGALLVAITKDRFEYKDRPNPHADHDGGSAVAQLALQATSLELGVHQMAGYDAELARQTYAIPEGYRSVCMIAVGHVAPPDHLPSDLQAREAAQRTRRRQSEFVFAETFGRAWTPSEEEGATAVLDFWFGPLDDNGLAGPAFSGRWWNEDEAFDEEVRVRFGPVYEELRLGAHHEWLHGARGRLATIVCLDQFTRNMFRGTERAHESDARALELALGAIELGFDRALPTDMRVFAYLPLMHAEDLATQDACCRLLKDMMSELEGDARDRVATNHDFALRHRDVIARFGRFPQRNAALGRSTTPSEQAYLDSGPSF